jgi:integrase/recombinase XerD
MNRQPPILKLSKAISGFLQYKAAEGLSPRTLECYEQHLKNLLTYAGDIDVCQVPSPQLRDYLVWLRVCRQTKWDKRD